MENVSPDKLESKESPIQRKHSFILVDDEKKTASVLMAMSSRDDRRLYKIGDVFWINRCDDENDTEPDSVRCEVTAITDSYDFYKNTSNGHSTVCNSNYFLKETPPLLDLEGYTWLNPNPFDKTDLGLANDNTNS